MVDTASILVVDDDVNFVTTTIDLLEERGFRSGHKDARHEWH